MPSTEVKIKIDTVELFSFVKLICWNKDCENNLVNHRPFDSYVCNLKQIEIGTTGHCRDFKSMEKK